MINYENMQRIATLRCTAQWESQCKELDLVGIAKQSLDKEFCCKGHKDPAGAVHKSMYACLTSKKGYYYDFALRTICSNFKHLRLFYSNVLPNMNNENEEYVKNGCLIYIPKSLVNFISTIEIAVKEGTYSLNNKDDVAEIFHKLYDKTMEFKALYRDEQHSEEDYTNYALNLSLGLYDSNLDEYFLYDVESNSSEAKSIKTKRMSNVFARYCSIVFNNDVAFEKLHFARVFIADFSAPKISRKSVEAVNLNAFCDRHGIGVDDEFKRTIFEKIPCINDANVRRYTKCVLSIFKEYPDCVDKDSDNYKNVTMFKKLYYHIYNSHFTN